MAEMDAAGRDDRARSPNSSKYSAANGGMPRGLDNPLGARALYIFQNGEDTLYRLHGSPEWNSIGKSVSSGCVRLINQDIIDLYDRVPSQTPVIVTAGVGVLTQFQRPVPVQRTLAIAALARSIRSLSSGCPVCRAPALGRPTIRPSGRPT